MQKHLYERIAAECARHPTRLWLHFLGEPLLHREAIEFISLAKRLGVPEVGLSTNAVALNPTTAERLLRSGLDRLECSVDGIDRADYARMRGRDHHERAIANIRAFLALKRVGGTELPVTSLQYLRTRAVETNLRQIVAEWLPHLGPRDFVMTIRPITFGGAIPPEPEGPAHVSAPRPPCSWLTQALLILQDGTVTMCGSDWDARVPLGNVATTTIAAIWNGGEMARRRQAHAARRFSEVGACATCEDWRLADGHGYRNAITELRLRR